MKITKAIVLSVCALGLASTVFAQAPGRIVTVDMQKLFDQYYKTPTARAKLEETRDLFTKELNVKQEELKKQAEELNKLREDQDRPEYTAAVREEKRKKMTDQLGDMQKLQRDMEEYRRSHQKILEEQSMRMRQGILKEITDVILKEAKDSGYMLVLDKSGNTLNGLPNIVFSQDSLEITPEILKILNKNAPAGTEAPKP